MDAVVDRLKDACAGQPAKIPWPHRLLHDAVAEIERLRAELQSTELALSGTQKLATKCKDEYHELLDRYDASFHRDGQHPERNPSVSIVEDWWNAPCAYVHPLGATTNPAEAGWTYGKVFCYLYAKNGFSSRVTGYGIFQGPYGLTQMEAWALTEHYFYFIGLLDGSAVDHDQFRDKWIIPELERLQATDFKEAP